MHCVCIQFKHFTHDLCLCKHHSIQDIQHFRHSQNVPFCPLQSISHIYHTPGDRLFDFYHYRLVWPIPECHINGLSCVCLLSFSVTFLRIPLCLCVSLVHFYFIAQMYHNLFIHLCGWEFGLSFWLLWIKLLRILIQVFFWKYIFISLR